jgi:hypothetical protein
VWPCAPRPARGACPCRRPLVGRRRKGKHSVRCGADARWFARPRSSQHTISPSIGQDRTLRWFTASTMSANRFAQSFSRLVSSRMPTGSRRVISRPVAVVLEEAGFDEAGRSGTRTQQGHGGKIVHRQPNASHSSRKPIFAWASCGVIPQMTKALVRDLKWSGLFMALAWISGHTRP